MPAPDWISPYTCRTCLGRAPLCSECFAEILRIHRGTAAARGDRWGESINMVVARPLRPWPAYDSPAGAKLRAIARRWVAELARGDEAATDALARACAAAAEVAYYRGPVRAGGVSFKSG